MLDELLLHFELSHHGGSLVRVVLSLDSSAEFLSLIVKSLLVHVGFDLDLFFDSVISHLQLFFLLHQELGLVDFNILSLLLGQVTVEVSVLGAGLVSHTFHTGEDGLVNQVGGSLLSIDLSLLNVDFSLDFLDYLLLLFDLSVHLSLILGDLLVLPGSQLLHEVGLLTLSIIDELIFNGLESASHLFKEAFLIRERRDSFNTLHVLLSDVVELFIIQVVVLSHLLLEFLIAELLEGARVDVVLTKLIILNLLLLNGVLNLIDSVLLLLNLVVHCILSFLSLLLSSSQSVLNSLILVFHLFLKGSLHLTHLVVKLG